MTNNENHPEVIVSMTTFPEAAVYAAGAVKSILNGSVLPDKVVLYITLDQFGSRENIPDDLLALEREHEIFEIRDYNSDIRSYRKLVPALHDFPEAIIVTVDDDVAYHRNMLRRLLEVHNKFPGHIIAHRAKRIIPGKPYRHWKKYRWYHFLPPRFIKRPDTIQTGVGGVLYPPGSLDMSMIDPALFTELAPTADDIWFWASALSAGNCVIPVPMGNNKPRGLGKPAALSLKSVNFKNGTDRNSETFHRILQRFPRIKDILESTDKIL